MDLGIYVLGDSKNWPDEKSSAAYNKDPGSEL